MQTAPLAPRRTLQVGIYRDGDNNLDAVQERCVGQARAVSSDDHHVAFTVEDTSHLSGGLKTRVFDICDGAARDVRSAGAQEMSDPKSLAAFVAHTLDEAQANGAKQTWIELVDHGGGDGGGLETSDGRVMAMPQIADAVAQGIAMHAREHPEDASRPVDGVIANQCLMATLGFSDALSKAGVRYLAASPETMVAPGVPSTVASDIERHEDDPRAMARAVVADVMRTRYAAGPLGVFGSYGPAAAFDVIDCNASGIGNAERAVASLNKTLTVSAADPASRAAIRADIASVDGMARVPRGDALPWRADRPAIAVYDRIADDARLDADVRSDAWAAADAVRSLVLAHAESRSFAPFGGTSYTDAAGPTVHLPLSARQVDPWAPRVSETQNAFYRAAGTASLVRAIA